MGFPSRYGEWGVARFHRRAGHDGEIIHRTAQGRWLVKALESSIKGAAVLAMAVTDVSLAE
jgi:hypothetical protein